MKYDVQRDNKDGWRDLRQALSEDRDNHRVWEMKRELSCPDKVGRPFLFCGADRVVYLDSRGYDNLDMLHDRLVRPFRGTVTLYNDESGES